MLHIRRTLCEQVVDERRPNIRRSIPERAQVARDDEDGDRRKPSFFSRGISKLSLHFNYYNYNYLRYINNNTILMRSNIILHIIQL